MDTLCLVMSSSARCLKQTVTTLTHTHIHTHMRTHKHTHIHTHECTHANNVTCKAALKLASRVIRCIYCYIALLSTALLSKPTFWVFI